MENFKIGQDYLDEAWKPKNPFEGLMAMEVTSEIISKIADAKFAWLDLIVQGQMSFWGIVTGKQIGRASCRERVCLYV